MKKIFLYAYDRRNLGDDLFVHTIANRYPDVLFYMWSDIKNRETFSCLSNLKIVDPNSRFVRALRKLRPSLAARYKGWLENRCNAVVYIGGSIFMEYLNWAQICTWWDWTAKNRPFFVLGANFGPYHTEAYRERMAEIFADCQDVCFRDSYSYNLFKNVPSVRQAPDILFSYPMPQLEVNEDKVFVSVINCAGRDESHNLESYDKSYVSNMAPLLKHQLDSGKSIVLASFCKEEGDEEGIKKILSAMQCESDPRISVLHYNGTNADELTAEIASSGSVIATRFHAAILAIAANHPVLPIIYSDKTKHVLNDLGFSGEMYDLREDTLWTSPCASSAPLPAKEAEKHFEKLDVIL